MMAGRGSSSPGAAGGPSSHVPVLLAEVMAALAPGRGEVHVDGTFGAGGYARALLEAGARVVAIDRDPEAVEVGRALAASCPDRFVLVQGRFSELDELATATGAQAVDGVVLDVGVSSTQLDRPERGFSFRFDGPLDMRMERRGPTAADVVNQVDEATLARVIAVLGEERRARAVARAVGRARMAKPIQRTVELADIVASAVGRGRPGDIHPATRTFQALRILVNRELEELARGLAAAERALKAGGRLAVVTFHSLEDRVVKLFLADRSGRAGGASRHVPERSALPPTFSLPNPKPVLPGEDEIARNPRARSAKLRSAVRTEASARPLDLERLGLPRLPKLALVAGEL